MESRRRQGRRLTEHGVDEFRDAHGIEARRTSISDGTHAERIESWNTSAIAVR